jgi:hypothetical protein
MQLLESPQDSYSLDDFARRNHIGLTTVYAEINAGRLIARKIGRRTVITIEDAREWRANLPKVAAATARAIGATADGRSAS